MRGQLMDENEKSEQLITNAKLQLQKGYVVHKGILEKGECSAIESTKITTITLECVDSVANRRPTMSTVIKSLEEIQIDNQPNKDKEKSSKKESKKKGKLKRLLLTVNSYSYVAKLLFLILIVVFQLFEFYCLHIISVIHYTFLFLKL
ncbi:unnamed protein product [Cuscuta epithymum]|uniref:Uncharacterized protein n=1 Tax=Cuscuta epithymum TaxID=186058 RepID=A0AAV0ESR8_9ASTE|nr:unnamed protein product [Cuscuta epithymum]